MTKYEMINDMQQKMEALADAKGAFRCGLIWDISGSLKTLREMLIAEDEAKMKEAAEDANDHHQHG